MPRAGRAAIAALCVLVVAVLAVVVPRVISSHHIVKPSAQASAYTGGPVWSPSNPSATEVPSASSTPTASPPPVILAGAYPSSPPARICGNTALLSGPTSPPSGAVKIPAGDNSHGVLGHNFTMKANTTYWFAPGVHTLGKNRDGGGQIIPAAGDTFIGAPGAILDGQGINHFAFTGRAKNVTIEYLTVQSFGTHSGPKSPSSDNDGMGVVNHDMGVGWNMSHLTVQYVAGAGVMVGSNNTLSYSCLRNNGQYGFQGEDPDDKGDHLVFDHIEVTGNDAYNWESHKDCGCSGADKFWAVRDVTIKDSWFHDNRGPGIWADTNDVGFDIVGNYVDHNGGPGFMYEISYNALVKNNAFVANGYTDGPATSGFPTGAIYLSESGSDPRVPGPFNKTTEITGNLFQDNWGGVIEWENANRVCGSDANSSTDYCTLVNPKVASLKACKARVDKAPKAPFIDDCRWKTQNVQVTKNTFKFDPKHVGPKCTVKNECGYNGIFSEYGTIRPYRGTDVEHNITLHQNNQFSDNTYVGPWRFKALEQGTDVSWDKWRSATYHQDAGSTFSG